MDDIRVIKNIFTEDERLEILKSIKPFLVDAEWLSLSCFGVPDKIPGKQSYPTLQHSPDFKWIYDRFGEIIKEKLNLAKLKRKKPEQYKALKGAATAISKRQ